MALPPVAAPDMEFAFILDPLASLKAYKDTSVAMMRALVARGHSLFALEQRDLYWDGKRTLASVRPLQIAAGDHDWFRVGAAAVRALESFSAVVMRKDPPFDMEYVYSTYLLEIAQEQGARVFNHPRALRDYNEKLSIAKFAEFIVPTLVTRNPALLGEF